MRAHTNDRLPNESNHMLTPSQTPIRVGIAGLGRSGWDIHGRTFADRSGQFQVAAVMDPDPGRRAEAVAKFGCRAHESFSALASDDGIEVVVVATPNLLHVTHTLEALARGKHVVCEKPFGQSSGDATRMIEAAREAGKLVAPFQNRRYEPHFLKAREVIESGVLGEVQMIRLAWHSFRRRWDWQTLTEFGGGELSNTGAHILDHAMQLFGEDEPEVTVDLRNILSSGDTEDHLKIVLRAPGAPLLEIELTNACAFPQDRWLVMGDEGGLRGTTTRLEWKWVDWSTHVPRELDRNPPQGRAYYSEKLEWHSDAWDGPDDFEAISGDFYEDFYHSVRGAQPLVITPESVRRNIVLVEKCKNLALVKQGRFSLTKASSGNGNRAHAQTWQPTLP